jgi:multiple sugar transport system ATP-binding protein
MAEIRLENLTKHFGELHAVEGLSLVVEHGSFTALLGPSGCGKTTTMNMISGLERPTRGEIYFDGHPVSRLEPGQRNVGFVFQNYAIFTHMSVYDNLAFGLRVKDPRPPKDEIDRDVRRVADTVGLTGALDRRVTRLSVNDLQKVALGRSMIVQPAIFLLDEPFSNLDAAFRAYMRAELKRIQHEIGQTMVYVTHDQVEAMGMANHIAVMNLGELQQFGTPDDLYNRPANRFVANFIGSVLNNFIPVAYETQNGRAVVRPRSEGSRDIDVSDRKGAIETRPDPTSGLTMSIRPERIQIVPPDSDEATLRARVVLVEPLGSRDIAHLDAGGVDVRAISAPGNRPRVGDAVGLTIDTKAVHVYDDDTGLALR